MASSRGILNIQSLNELTSENGGRVRVRSRAVAHQHRAALFFHVD